MQLCLPTHHHRQADSGRAGGRAVLREMALLPVSGHAGALQRPVLAGKPVGTLGWLEEGPRKDPFVVYDAAVL